MRQIQLSVPTLFGLEGVAAEEMRRLGQKEVKGDNGRVYCLAEPKDIPRLNIGLRTGERVQIVLGSFTALSFDDLFEQVKALPWEDFIPRNGAFPVKGHTLNSQLASEPACQSIIKKAVVDRLSAKYHTHTLPEDGLLYQIQFSLIKNQAVLLLDTTGSGLFKRGYREGGVMAPLRETLAAGLVLLSRYHGRESFCDPFCGSGTIPIEAALIAKNRAPGLNRSFAAQKWPWLAAEAWTEAVDEALAKEYHGEYDIWGGDLDYSAIKAAEKNAVNAKVDDVVRFSVLDSAKLRRTEPSGRVVTNPPYGERLLEQRQAEMLYRDLGKAMQRMSGGWQSHIITSHPEFPKFYGLEPDKRRKLYNGLIKCTFYSYLPKIK